MMKTETISACMQASFADTPFPVVVQTLAGAGVTSYRADLMTLRKTYYDAGTDAIDEPMPLRDAQTVAAAFDRDTVAATVKAIQMEAATIRSDTTKRAALKRNWSDRERSSRLL